MSIMSSEQGHYDHYAREAIERYFWWHKCNTKENKCTVNAQCRHNLTLGPKIKNYVLYIMQVKFIK